MAVAYAAVYQSPVLGYGRRNREWFSLDLYKFLSERGLNISDFAFYTRELIII